MREVSLWKGVMVGAVWMSLINDVLAMVRLVLRLYLIKFVMDF